LKELNHEHFDDLEKDNDQPESTKMMELEQIKKEPEQSQGS
jgi:hypothetical protein